jgi:hypothetical protein
MRAMNGQVRDAAWLAVASMERVFEEMDASTKLLGLLIQITLAWTFQLQMQSI